MIKSKQLRDFLSNGWVLGIGTTVIGGLIFNWITGKNIISNLLSWASGWLERISSWILDFFTTNYELPLYVLILIFLSAPLLFIVFRVTMLYIEKRGKESGVGTKNNWEGYMSDIFGGIPYRWDYVTNSLKQNVITNIRAYCPKCDCMLISQKCPNCGRYFLTEDLKSNGDVISLVLLRLEKDFNQKI